MRNDTEEDKMIDGSRDAELITNRWPKLKFYFF